MDRKEAIEIIIKNYPHVSNSGSQFESALRELIPELNESEDEKIRKGIIELIKQSSNILCPQTQNKMIAYLEKQKEQKPAESWTIQDAHPGDILNSARVQTTIIFKGFNPDGKHLDAYCALQKGFFIAQELPWDRDFEPATQVWKDALFDAMVRKGYLWDAENKRLNKAVQKPAEIAPNQFDGITYGMQGYSTEKPAEWSEEDKDYFDAIIAKLEVTQDDAMLTDNQFNFLKSLPERFNPQPKQEWSEEDEQYLLVCKNALNKYQRSDQWDANIISKWLEERLKSLRPQPHWKPSEEQMKALGIAIRCGIQLGTWEEDALRSLNDELKSL